MERAAIVLAGVLLLSPMAAAQDPAGVTATLQGWQSPLAVDEVNEQATLTIEYNCGRVGPQGSTAEVNITGPPWAEVDGPEAIPLEPRPEECLQSETRLTVAAAYSVSVTRQAPAVMEENVTFDVTATFPDGEASDEAVETLSAAFLADIDVAVEPERIEAFSGRTSEHNLTVTNRGNAPITISVTVLQVDTGLELRVPANGEAPSPLGDEEPVWRGTVSATAQLPAGVNARTFNATLDLSASHAEGASQESTTRQLNLTAAIERHPSEIDEGGPIPGFEAVGLVVAAVAVATFARRRR